MHEKIIIYYIYTYIHTCVRAHAYKDIKKFCHFCHPRVLVPLVERLDGIFELVTRFVT